MTWDEAKAVAGKLHLELARQFSEAEIRLILRALARLHHSGKGAAEKSLIADGE